MCGICGIINYKEKPVSRNLLEKMNNTLIHRGPDDDGYYFSDAGRRVKVGLGMRRLSIIDLDTGSQPLYNENKSVVTVFNGEIYNFRELKKNLTGKGHKFYTGTDTEIIVHLWEEYGKKCVRHLNGMFAIALWDSRKNELFLARDRVGQKPLYYAQIGKSFYFSSEIKSFLKIPEFKKEVNRKAIHYYLTYQYIPSPMTIWKGVKAIKPANFMRVGGEGIKEIKRYWNIDYRNNTELTFKQSKKKIRELLKDATRKRMIADVPLGAFLSGGHDSSIIVGLMSEISADPIKTFSIGFKDQKYSELEYAREVSQRFKTDHHELIVEPNYIDEISKLVRHYDQPYADSSALPSYYLSKVTRDYVKVTLNGDGGDENFAGYSRYNEYLMLFNAVKNLKHLPPVFLKFINTVFKKTGTGRSRVLRRAKKVADMLTRPPEDLYLIWNNIFDRTFRKRIYSEDMKAVLNLENPEKLLTEKISSVDTGNVIDALLYADMNLYLPEDLMVKMDIASMANSVETRSPFLDYKLMEFIASLPANWKLNRGKSKIILKDAFKQDIPEKIYSRDKMGFAIPLDDWFRNEWGNYFREIVLSEKAKSRGYFKPGELEKIYILYN